MLSSASKGLPNGTGSKTVFLPFQYVLAFWLLLSLFIYYININNVIEVVHNSPQAVLGGVEVPEITWSMWEAVRQLSVFP